MRKEWKEAVAPLLAEGWEILSHKGHFKAIPPTGSGMPKLHFGSSPSSGKRSLRNFKSLVKRTLGRGEKR